MICPEGPIRMPNSFEVLRPLMDNNAYPPYGPKARSGFRYEAIYSIDIVVNNPIGPFMVYKISHK